MPDPLVLPFDLTSEFTDEELPDDPQEMISLILAQKRKYESIPGNIYYDRKHKKSQFVLYRMHSHTYGLLYIGKTIAPRVRFKYHMTQKDWWLEVDYIDLERFASQKDLDEAELNAIKDEKPKYNILGVLK